MRDPREHHYRQLHFWKHEIVPVVSREFPAERDILHRIRSKSTQIIKKKSRQLQKLNSVLFWPPNKPRMSITYFGFKISQLFIITRKYVLYGAQLLVMSHSISCNTPRQSRSSEEAEEEKSCVGPQQLLLKKLKGIQKLTLEFFFVYNRK